MCIALPAEDDGGAGYRWMTTHEPYKLRVAFAFLVKTAASAGLSWQWAYLVTQYSLIFLLLMLAIAYGDRVLGSRRLGYAFCAVLALSYPVLFVDIMPSHTWDDMLLACVLLLALLLLHSGREVAFVLVVTAGVLVKETAVLISPIILLYSRASLGRRLIGMLVAPLAYLAYRTAREARYTMWGAFSKHLPYNFADWPRSFESLSYVWLGTGPVLIASLFAYWELVRRAPRPPTDTERFLCAAFTVMVPLYLLINALGGRLREIRISFPHVLAAAPLALNYLSKLPRPSLLALQRRAPSLLIGLVLVALASLALLSGHVVVPTRRSDAPMAWARNFYIVAELVLTFGFWTRVAISADARPQAGPAA